MCQTIWNRNFSSNSSAVIKQKLRKNRVPNSLLITITFSEWRKLFPCVDNCPRCLRINADGCWSPFEDLLISPPRRRGCVPAVYYSITRPCDQYSEGIIFLLISLAATLFPPVAGAQWGGGFFRPPSLRCAEVIKWQQRREGTVIKWRWHLNRKFPFIATGAPLAILFSSPSFNLRAQGSVKYQEKIDARGISLMSALGIAPACLADVKSHVCRHRPRLHAFLFLFTTVQTTWIGQCLDNTTSHTHYRERSPLPLNGRW